MNVLLLIEPKNRCFYYSTNQLKIIFYNITGISCNSYVIVMLYIEFFSEMLYY